ncbi:uncharacterized protein DC041_0007575 [Schistosoma bovis]|uniref:MRH domain-containing protein n=1 Tax=Schistosoma bovis TaxID=6184 RepID=A0A430QNT5_SCHBO|nr:uncharacterized protein DC041_0007575 [Schistosoma bovis]
MLVYCCQLLPHESYSLIRPYGIFTASKITIPTPIPIDYGPEEGFRMLTELPNGCLELNDREYTYSLCPFKSVHQKSIGSSNSDPGTCIGRWGRWLESDEYEKSYKVFVHCGDSNHLTSVNEPSRCEYVMQLITPAACSEDPDELFKKLHPELIVGLILGFVLFMIRKLHRPTLINTIIAGITAIVFTPYYFYLNNESTEYSSYFIGFINVFEIITLYLFVLITSLDIGQTTLNCDYGGNE